MAATGRPIWFVGDPADPAARALASALAASRARLIDAPAGLPDPWPAVGAGSPEVVVVHRAHLGSGDLDRLTRLRTRLGPSRRIVLCVGPHARHAEIERWAPVVDVVLPELTAAATIARHVASGREAPLSSAVGGAVAVVSTNRELRAALADILRAAGFDPIEQGRPEEPPGRPAVATVWDVPALEPAWPGRLAERARRGPLVALVGFLDRSQDRLARAAGASSCLDLPCDAADLVRAVDRAAGVRRDEAHPTPPSPSRRRRRRG